MPLRRSRSRRRSTILTWPKPDIERWLRKEREFTNESTTKSRAREWECLQRSRLLRSRSGEPAAAVAAHVRDPRYRQRTDPGPGCETTWRLAAQSQRSAAWENRQIQPGCARDHAEQGRDARRNASQKGRLAARVQ